MNINEKKELEKKTRSGAPRSRKKIRRIIILEAKGK